MAGFIINEGSFSCQEGLQAQKRSNHAKLIKNDSGGAEMTCETIFWNKSNLLDGSFGTILQEAAPDNAGVPLYFAELLYIMGAFLKNALQYMTGE